ncbi:hypothetical protein E5676_scaffold194G002450 [Cucumis melo var. makuwa]|uniref:Uncharacterized protein n=1 Tax=Cucumis melo var. makuwa TaxID=1194695 RepID=A0A5D3BC55_CUCMM|nr:hypothetical protein E5676_scaffold194G002450 [Cucumis melo var. makuwa]
MRPLPGAITFGLGRSGAQLTRETLYMGSTLAHVVRCLVKSYNERNPHFVLLRHVPKDQLFATKVRRGAKTAREILEEDEDDVKSAWPLWAWPHTCTLAMTMGGKAVRRSAFGKIALVRIILVTREDKEKCMLFCWMPHPYSGRSFLGIFSKASIKGQLIHRLLVTLLEVIHKDYSQCPLCSVNAVRRGLRSIRGGDPTPRCSTFSLLIEEAVPEE